MQREAFSPAALWSVTRETVKGWLDDFAPSMGAGIAYYTAFSIAPLLIIVITIAGLFFGQEAASGYVYEQLADLLGPQGADAVRAMVDAAGKTEEGVLAPVIGVTLLLVGATTVFAELQSDLDRIWKAPAVKQQEGLWGLLRRRVLSLGLVVSIGFLMLVSLVFSAALSAFGRWWSGWFEDFQWLLRVLDVVVSLAVISLMFALMYKILPRVKIGWRDVWIGAVATALLFTIGKLLVGLYIGRSKVASGFGAASSLVILMLWVYYSAQIFLLGAEFTWVYTHRYGSRRGQSRPATTRESLDETPQEPSPRAGQQP
jgi:membrane protein